MEVDSDPPRNGGDLPPILLDWNGDAEAADAGEQAIEVSDELALLDGLRRYCHEKRSLFVHGGHLCGWVTEWAQGRGIETIAVRSLADELRMLCPGLDPLERRALQFALTRRQQVMSAAVSIDAALSHKKESSRLSALLTALWPDGPWQDGPSLAHAATWLLWLSDSCITDAMDDTNDTDALLPLAYQQAGLWQQGAKSEAVAYEVASPQQATHLLESWIFGPSPSSSLLASPLLTKQPFPVSIPSRWMEGARARWTTWLPAVGGGEALWNHLSSAPFTYQLRTVAAQVVAEYGRVYPATVTPHQITALTPFLSDTETTVLRGFCPPPVPSKVRPEDEPSGVFRWFEQEYLPYRLWQIEHGDAAANSQVALLAESFARWCLRFYPSAIAGGRGTEFLAVQAARNLREVTNSSNSAAAVVLWVVLDGLPFPDARTVVRELLHGEPRLSLDSLKPVVGSLPTITFFTKNALMNGAPMGSDALAGEKAPTPTPAFPGARRLLGRDSDHEAVTKAQAGEILVLSLLEPDHTYHSPRGTVAVSQLRHEVNGVLRAAVGKIRDLVRAVPDELLLRIVLSTDHGRLLGGKVPRICPVPDGMIAEQRAAWCSAPTKTSAIDFGAEGVSFVSGGIPVSTLNAGDEPPSEQASPTIPIIAYLSASRFDLPSDCAVMVSGEAFLQNDGRSGSAPFAHGGLWPEEVLTPWAEMRRDAVQVVQPVVKCRITGEGRAGGAGSVTLTIENGGRIALSVVSVRFQGPSNTFPLTLPAEKMVVPALSQNIHETLLFLWPFLTGNGLLTATIEIALPHGEHFEVPVAASDIDLQTTALYQQSLSARDLEDF